MKKILFTLSMVLLLNSNSQAEIIADWGTIATPISSETSFSFAQYDLTDNFLHSYTFSLAGEAGASYVVSFDFSPCSHGCGSPDLSYGIYDANGSLYDSSNGNLVLSSGNYTFQVHGTGMGDGNNLDYFGSVSFSLSSVEMVSPAPELASWQLALLALLMLLLSRGYFSRGKPDQPAHP